jgi:hypothetical protein
MVQTDIPQLSRECNDWREALRSYREQFNRCKSDLQLIAGHPLSKDLLTEVERYHNQFHIQLINIHDLKQAIKSHDRRLQFEASAHDGQITEETLADHESLYDQFVSLENMLKELAGEFDGFKARAN